MTETAAPPAEERRPFQAEVGRLLDIVARSLYSDRSVFLRELISNASDACDRLRYEALTRPELAAEDTTFRVTLAVDKAARTLTVTDNGIGMNRGDLVENLGTIARSGTAAFLQGLTGDAKKDVAAIGQFGVGFYAAFMVADRVEVTSRKAGEAEAWRWSSDGRGEFAVAPAVRAKRGTEILLHLRGDAEEFLDPDRLGDVVARHSDHVAIPIVLLDRGERTLNRGSALWARGRGEVTAEQHRDFYRHVAHAMDEPFASLHWRAEGKFEYAALLYVPGAPPFDLFHPEGRHGIKLYVRRVFVTDRCDELAPRWLRFLRGVVDSEDLPLNIGRELLQHNPIVTAIRAGVVNRVLGELDKRAKDAPGDYARFWENFGAVLKEGLCEAGEHRDRLLALARFESSRGDGWTSLADYASRMRPGQEAIYFVAGDDAAALRGSPQLEGFKAKGVEALLLVDPVDEFWMAAVGAFEGKAFKSVTRGGADLGKIAGPEDRAAATGATVDGSADIAPLIAVFRLALGEAVKDVRVSDRLTDSPACLVADEADLDIHLERLLLRHKQLAPGARAKRILEINPQHALARALLGRLAAGGAAATEEIGEAAHLLLDQARLAAGETVADPLAFGRRLASALVRGLAAAK